MTRAVESITLKADCNRIGAPYLIVETGGGCIHVAVYESENNTNKISFQMSEAVFEQWANAFQLFTRSK